MEEADHLCDRVAIMDHGRILALDTPAALKQSIGADNVVSVRTTGDLDKLGGAAGPRHHQRWPSPTTQSFPTRSAACRQS